MSKGTAKMRWLNTTGGPFACGDAAIAKIWQGVFGSSGPMGQNDYERACQVTSYHQSIVCGPGRLMVLGDEPLQSTLFVNSRSEPCIARWVYSSNSDVDDFIFGVERLQEIETRIQLSLLSGSLVLFDSSAPLDRCEPTAAERIAIEPGHYEVTAEKAEKAKELSFIIHRFLRI